MIHSTKLSLIAVIGRNRELGLNNRLLWHIPEDLKHFKLITENHAVIMGRKTYESIGRPLPKRLNIIITRDKTFKISRHSGKPKAHLFEPEPQSRRPESVWETNDGFWTSQNDNIIIVYSLEQAIEEASKWMSLRVRSNIGRSNPVKNEIFIIGGGQVFQESIKLADKLYLTIVEDAPKADTYFPDYSEFIKVIKEECGNSAGLKYRFVEMEK